MTTWREFVKDVQAKKKISYKEALKKASPLWAKQKGKKTKITSKKKKKKVEPLKEPEEVVDFPKQEKKKKKKGRDPGLGKRKAAERLSKVRKRQPSLVIDHAAKKTAKLSGL